MSENIREILWAATRSTTKMSESILYNNSAQNGMADDEIKILLLEENATIGAHNASEDIQSIHGMDYGIRFIAYSVLAALGLLFNILSFAALSNMTGRRSVHHVFLQNLAICDMFGTVLLWMYYNSPFIFSAYKGSGFQHCMFIALVLVAPFLLSLCSSCLSLLMLALNQYLAICNPLFATTRISRGTACCCIVGCWVLSIALSTIPAFLMLAINSFKECAPLAESIGVKAVEICSYVLSGLIILIVALYGRIYREVLEYRKRIPQLQLHSPRDVGPGRRNDTERNFKAFITTFLLSGTLVIFWIPFVVIHFISAHIDYDLIPKAVYLLKFYLVDFLPMLNFMTDPVIYGIRMKEIRGGYKRLFAKLFPKCIKLPHEPYTRNSVRFTTLDTTTFWGAQSYPQEAHKEEARGSGWWPWGFDRESSTKDNANSSEFIWLTVGPWGAIFLMIAPAAEISPQVTQQLLHEQFIDFVLHSDVYHFQLKNWFPITDEQQVSISLYFNITNSFNCMSYQTWWSTFCVKPFFFFFFLWSFVSFCVSRVSKIRQVDPYELSLAYQNSNFRV